MTEKERKQRIHDIVYSCDSREELAERIVGLEDEGAKLRELARDLRFCARQSICLKCEHGRICDLRLDERCAELGIGVDG